MTDLPADNASSRQPPWIRNPFATLLRLPDAIVKDGTARLELVVEEIHLRPGGIVHGGIYATLLDTVTGFAAYNVAPTGNDVVTMQLNLNMTSAATLSEKLIAVAKVVHSGRKTAVVTGEIRTPDGRLIATGSGTFFFVDGKLTS